MPLVGIKLKEMKPLSQKDICTPMLTAKLFTINKKWKQSKCLLKDEWIKKIYISLKRKFLTCLTKWMNPEDEDIMLSEINQSQKDKYCMIPLHETVKFIETESINVGFLALQGKWEIAFQLV